MHSDLERRLIDGDREAFAAYTGEAIECYLHDTTELNRRKAFLAKYCKGDLLGVYGVALLSALTRDLRGWEVALEFMGEDVDPALGHHSYKTMVRQGADDAELESWFFLIQSSAQRGHILSGNIVFDKKVATLGYFALPLRICQRIWVGVKFLFLHFRNPSDRRLPRP